MNKKIKCTIYFKNGLSIETEISNEEKQSFKRCFMPTGIFVMSDVVFSNGDVLYVIFKDVEEG